MRIFGGCAKNPKIKRLTSGHAQSDSSPAFGLKGSLWTALLRVRVCAKDCLLDTTLHTEGIDSGFTDSALELLTNLNEIAA